MNLSQKNDLLLKSKKQSVIIKKEKPVMRRLLVFILLAVVILPPSVIKAQVIGQNLIANPSCEDSAANNKIPLWTEVSGFEWQRQSSTNGSFPPAWDGQYLFFAGQTDSAELRQDVNVTVFASSIDAGTRSFVFHGYVRSYDQSPPDSSRIIIEYRADTVSAPLRTFDSHNIGNVVNWQLVSDSALAPWGTRLIRIRLMSTRFAGTDNDGYYDALSLIASGPMTGLEKESSPLPKEFGMNQNYPNPFNPSTKIGFTLPYESAVHLCVYNTLGQLVAELDNSIRSAGYNEVSFNASCVPGGIYLYSITAKSIDGKNEYRNVKKMLYLK
jgi:hypothetical protein